MNEFTSRLLKAQLLHVQQVWEGFEIVLGWETRNKYRIFDENMKPLGFAAEKSTGVLGAIFRQFLGHWKRFDITVFNDQKEIELVLRFPFRWLFKTLIVEDAHGKVLGTVEQRFAIFRKKFDVLNRSGRVTARINSSFFRFWTFEFRFGPKKLGTVQKKWSGALGEFFSDKDNFVVSFADPNLDEETKSLMLATCLMVDIVYFENNKGSKSFNLFD